MTHPVQDSDIANTPNVARDTAARRFVASGRLIAELADSRMFYLAEGFNGDMEWKPVPEVPA